MNSALPRMVQPVSSEARVSLMSGVLPIASTTRLLMVMCLNRRFLPDHLATLVDRRRAPQADWRVTGFERMSAPSIRLCEHDLRTSILPDRIRPRNKPGNIPTTAGTVVEAKRQFRLGQPHGNITPGRQRLGIILSENAFADNGNAETVSPSDFNTCGEGSIFRRGNVALDEVDLAPIVWNRLS